MSNIKDIMNQHRKRTKTSLVYEALARDRSEQFKKDYEAKRQAEAAAVPLEAKKKFIECMKNGKTIGESMKEAGIESLDAACVIFEKSIRRIEILGDYKDE